MMVGSFLKLLALIEFSFIFFLCIESDCKLATFEVFLDALACFLFVSNLVFKVLEMLSFDLMMLSDSVTSTSDVRYLTFYASVRF